MKIPRIGAEHPKDTHTSKKTVPGFQGNAQEQQIANMNTIDAQRPIIYASIIGIFQSQSLPKGKKYNSSINYANKCMVPSPLPGSSL